MQKLTPEQIIQQQNDYYISKKYAPGAAEHEWFVKRQADVVAEADRAARAKADKIAKETAKLAGQLLTAESNFAITNERRRLASEPSPDFTAQMYAGKLSADEVTKTLQARYNEFRSQVNISDADATLLVKFLSQNRTDSTDIKNWYLGLDFIEKTLQALQPVVTEPVTPAPVTVAAEPVCPHRYSDNPRSPYAQWQLTKSREDLKNELADQAVTSPIFAESVRSLCESSSLTMTWAEICRLKTEFASGKYGEESVKNIRRAAIALFGNNVGLNAEEIAEREDAGLSGTDYRRKHGIIMNNSYDPNRAGTVRS